MHAAAANSVSVLARLCRPPGVRYGKKTVNKKIFGYKILFSMHQSTAFVSKYGFVLCLKRYK